MGLKYFHSLRMHSSSLFCWKTFVGHLQGSSVDVVCAQGETWRLKTTWVNVFFCHAATDFFFPDRQHVNVNPLSVSEGLAISVELTELL